MITQILRADSEEEIDEAINRYLERYDSNGYGTMIQYKKRLPTGEWEAKMVRGCSCD